MTPTFRRPLRAAAAATLSFALLGSLAACGGEEESAAPASSSVIDQARCDANRDAGEITFLTSYAYTATVGILDVVAAQELGYFDDLCLDVKIQPGTDNVKLVSAGRAQLGGIGSPGDTMVGIQAGGKIQGIATYGNTTAIELITMKDGDIQSLEDFVGQKVGYKGYISPQLKAMFATNGVDPDTIDWVSVGYDPTILAQDKVAGLGAYKSNEPKVLEATGHAVTEWDPAEYGVESAFNTQIANTAFAEKNPTAVEDFLRASLHALDWLETEANLDQALGWAEGLSDAGYDVAQSKVRFSTEMELIAANQPEGVAVGTNVAERWDSDFQMLLDYDLADADLDVNAAYTNDYIDAVTDAGAVVWPEEAN